MPDVLQEFSFVDRGRTFQCRVAASRVTGPDPWWWFEVSTEQHQRHAPFRADPDDTYDVVQQRMVAYYESPGSTPPAHLLPHIAAALGVSIDALYGQAPQPKQLAKQEVDSRLRRRLLAIEKLETNDKRQVLQMIDAFIERGQLKRKVASQTQA